MSFITNLLTQQRAVAARISGNQVAFAGRDNMLGAANKPIGSLKQLQRDEVCFTSGINQGNLTAKFAGKMEEAAREKMKKEFENGLTGFNTFA